MRPLICTLSLLVLATICNAQSSDERPFRFHMDIGFGLPLKDFKKDRNNNFVVGQATEGWGFGLKASKAIVGNLYLGLGPRVMYYNLERNAISNQALALYDNNKYYTDIDVRTHGLFLIYLGGQISWVFNTRAISIEPFIETGIVLAELDGKKITSERKRQNSNYTDSLNIYNTDGKTPSAMYGMFGIRLNKKVAKRLNVSLSASYAITENMKFRFRPELIDYFGNKQELSSFRQRNAFQTIQFETGIQFRMWRSKKQ